MRHVIAFINGMREFRLSSTMHYDGSLATAYDMGREFAHRITLRKFEV